MFVNFLIMWLLYFLFSFFTYHLKPINRTSLDYVGIQVFQPLVKNPFSKTIFKMSLIEMPLPDGLESFCIGHFRFECPRGNSPYSFFWGPGKYLFKKKKKTRNNLGCSFFRCGQRMALLSIIVFSDAAASAVIHKVFGAMHSLWFCLGHWMKLVCGDFAK